MAMARHRRWVLIPAAIALLAVAFPTGCSQPPKVVLVPTEVTSAQTRIDATLADASDVENLIRPYRSALSEKMGEPLAFCPQAMETGKPEGLLGDLVADIALERARQETGLPVDVCILNNGGLRIPWPAGMITLGLVYEVMPFDNEIVVLRLSADQMRTLADELAARGGEPVSGMTLRIDGQRAADVRVGSEPLAERDYWVATSDYLASGGGGMETLWAPRETRQSGVLLRDAIADALRRWGVSGATGGERGRIPVPAQDRVR